MGKGPGSFGDIGKKAKDVLYKDYFYDQKFSISTKTQSGVSFHTTGLKKGEEFSSDVKSEFHYADVKTEIKVDHKSKIHVAVQAEDVAPGLKATVKGIIPDANSGKVELHYKQPFSHSSLSVGLVSQPVLEGAVALGAHGLVVGGEAAYDTATSTATKYNFGVGIVQADYAASILVTDKLDTVKASYLHTLSSDTSLAVEIAHKVAKKDITFTAGASYKLDPLTLTKIRLNNRGSIAALVQHEYRPKSHITFSGEVDSKNIDKSAKFGVALSLKP